MASERDNAKGKAVELPPRPILRGGSSRGGAGRGQQGGRGTEPQPPPNIEEGGGDISLSDYEEEDFDIHIPLSDMERFLDEEEARDQNNPRRSSSQSTGFEVQVQGKYNYLFKKFEY